MNKLIAETIHRRNKLADGDTTGFNAGEVDEFLEKVSDIIEKAYEEHDAMKETDLGFDDERKLINFIIDYTQELFRWLTDFSLPVTNNCSEYAMRNGLKRFNKIILQFKSINGVRERTRIAEYIL